jgi:mono/diheme cytochrome c family protein
MGNVMTKGWIFTALLVGLVIPFAANAQPGADVPRGDLLYMTHCIACHDANIHWRDKKVATDWDSLKEEVRHWQEVTGLDWSDDDIEEVARYLNAHHYHFPEHVQ